MLVTSGCVCTVWIFGLLLSLWLLRYYLWIDVAVIFIRVLCRCCFLRLWTSWLRLWTEKKSVAASEAGRWMRPTCGRRRKNVGNWSRNWNRCEFLICCQYIFEDTETVYVTLLTRTRHLISCPDLLVAISKDVQAVKPPVQSYSSMHHYKCIVLCKDIHTHTHTRLTALFPGLPRWAGTSKVKPIWILLKQVTVSGSGISWAICKSAPSSRQITMPPLHHSVFYRPDALPAAQPTASKDWRHKSTAKTSVSNKIFWFLTERCQLMQVVLYNGHVMLVVVVVVVVIFVSLFLCLFVCHWVSCGICGVSVVRNSLT